MLFTHPKRAFAFIIQHRYEKHLGVLAVLIGIENAFSRAARQHMGNDYPLWGIVFFCVIIGSLFGYITLWFASYIIHITGRRLNGNAHTHSILLR